jgi:hypothetical protein
MEKDFGVVNLMEQARKAGIDLSYDVRLTGKKLLLETVQHR